MKLSVDHIVTTHTGSLPKPDEVDKLQAKRTAGEEIDAAAYEAAIRAGTQEVVRRQLELGIEVPNDGEVPKIGGFAGYIRQRWSGYESTETEPRPLPGTAQDFPEYGEKWSRMRRPVADGEIAWKDFSVVDRDATTLHEAANAAGAQEAFITASSPGTVVNHNPNRHYGHRLDYLAALADLLQREYEAIVDAGLILQIDCPDLAASHDTFYPDMSVKDFRKLAMENAEALNHATRNIAPDRMRIHTCWGAAIGPHSRDIELKDVVDILLSLRPQAIGFVAANPRHSWEHVVWEEIKIPDDKVLVPGVIDSTSMTIEHPRTVAEQIVRYANIVGRERVIAGVDCGMGYWSPQNPGMGIPPSIVWAKLRTLAEGAELATKELWG